MNLGFQFIHLSIPYIGFEREEAEPKLAGRLSGNLSIPYIGFHSMDRYHWATPLSHGKLSIPYIGFGGRSDENIEKLSFNSLYRVQDNHGTLAKLDKSFNSLYRVLMFMHLTILYKFFQFPISGSICGDKMSHT
jgi:hypothetical protein